MASAIKQHILKKVYENVSSKVRIATIDQIAPHISVHRSPKNESEIQLTLPVTVDLENEKEFTSTQVHSTDLLPDDIILQSKLLENGSIRYVVDTNNFVKDVLDSNPTKLNFKPEKRRVIVEFSSPNVAKPFHVGHLRSTIIGNFVANLKEKMGKDVHRLNYLGDWGTQFGFLKLGIDNMNVPEETLQAQPTKTLFEAYVWANKEANTDQSLHEKAREEFRRLEAGDKESTASWEKFKKLSIADLADTYKRLNVKFDDYHWESDFGIQEVENVLNRLREQGMLRTDDKQRKCATVRGKLVPLVKSDGATLYLARDVAAVMHRRKKLEFQDMYYVVENGQAEHFLSLFAICNDLGVDQAWNMRHIKFGRIHGMSTRRGNVVFLDDILNQARDLVFERLKSSKTSKVEPTHELADVLGCGSVIINDLKQRRVKDYDFSWEKALQVSGDTCVRLQYTHCRLCSLLANSAYAPAEQCDPAALTEPEALALVFEIARYEESLLRSHTELESCILVNYLFSLTHAANKAFKVLPVKGSGGHVGSQRLLLFKACKNVVGDALKVLGITPLEQM